MKQQVCVYQTTDKQRIFMNCALCMCHIVR